MRKTAFFLSVLLSAAVAQADGGAASLVAKESKTKDYNYSWELERFFLEECTQSANEQVCECVLRKIQKQYSEAEYLKFDAALRKNIDCPEFTSYISSAVKTCDSEYVSDSRRAASYGTGDGLAALLGGGGGIATKAKGSIKTPSERDIKISGSRSAADVMKVVRQRTPGLRHIYNKFLKKKPGFLGKVTLKFTIAPSGDIISIAIASSTTGYGEFDADIKSDVSRWRFGKVASGNTTVTIPFTFVE